MEEADLTIHHASEPLGERIIVKGRVLDEGGRPVPDTLVEIWQCNAAGRYHHAVDQHQAPLDPNFTGAGRCVTDAAGNYKFISIKPGAIPAQPSQRLAPGASTSPVRPLVPDAAGDADVLPRDPLFSSTIFNSVPIPRRASAWSASSIWRRQSRSGRWANFDIVLRGSKATRGYRHA